MQQPCHSEAIEVSSAQIYNAGGNRKLSYIYTPGRLPGVVFLSGFRSDMTGSKATHLDAHCRGKGHGFLRFDYTGHGSSSGKFEDGAIGDWLQDALDIFDAVTEGPQVLVGSSMGGWLALLLARERPQRVAGLVGIAAAPDFTEALVWEQFTPAQKKQLLEQGKVEIPDCYGSQPYPITKRLVEEGRRHLLLDAPSLPIACPIRLMHGMKDEDVPYQFSLEIVKKALSDNVSVSLIKNGGHRLSEPENLSLLAHLVDDVLSLVGE